LSTKLHQMPGMPQPENNKHYLWGASANAALPSLMKQLLVGLTDANKASMDSLEEAYNDRFRKHVPDAVIRRSAEFGKVIANAIYQWSTTDNFNLSSTGYTLPVCPSCWVLVPPATAAVGPFLKDSRPFLAYSLTATAPPLPFPYSEDPTSEFYKAAKEVYEIGKALTPEQKLIPTWFADAGGPGVGLASAAHNLSIITWVLEKKNAKLGQAAQIYAKTSIAFKDALVIVWRSKFDVNFNLLRPVTYINRHIDPTWTTFLPNPPYPDYLSGLVSLYSSSLQVLKREYGDIPITDVAYVWRGSGTREYASITELVEEAGFSRVLAGIHYQFTQDITIKVAKDLGNEIANIRLVHSNH
ncbi:MAG TPA: vanadium-dependent haloperoxidase, partial [Chitinophagaceae bacterium]|nr:vanadium-dependent haloperoxidase [Chitinophagaceae bacterium]